MLFKVYLLKHYRWSIQQINQPYFSWTYTCIDILDLIRTKYTGTNVSLQRISLQKASESQSFYVDVVYIGQTATISTLDGMLYHFISTVI